MAVSGLSDDDQVNDSSRAPSEITPWGERRYTARAGEATPCKICGDRDPVHVHTGSAPNFEGPRIEDYFTVGRGQTDFSAARYWKRRTARAEQEVAALRADVERWMQRSERDDQAARALRAERDEWANRARASERNYLAELTRAERMRPVVEAAECHDCNNPQFCAVCIALKACRATSEQEKTDA